MFFVCLGQSGLQNICFLLANLLGLSSSIEKILVLHKEKLEIVVVFCWASQLCMNTKNICAVRESILESLPALRKAGPQLGKTCPEFKKTSQVEFLVVGAASCAHV